MAFAGQLAISTASLVIGLVCVAAAGELGLPASRGLYTLGAFAAALAWGVALGGLVSWMAQRAKGAFYSPATMRRVSTRSFFGVLVCYGGAVLLAFGTWRAMNPSALSALPGAKMAALRGAIRPGA
jgi:hypothetical protein